MRKASTAAALSLLLLLPIAFVHASSPAAVAAGSAVFNTPRPYAKAPGNYAIINRVQRAIRGVPAHQKGKPRQVIHLTTYLLDHTSTVTSLIKACRRGVAVRVILDEEIQNRNARRLITTLNADNVRDRNRDGKADSKPRARPCNRPLNRTSRQDTSERTLLGVSDDALLSMRRTITSVDAPLKDSVTWGRDRSYVKRCTPSCRSGRGNMHMKIFLFSRTGRSKNVVMVSSSNLNRGGATLGWNDMYVMRNRPKSYGEYVDVHRLMTIGRRAPRERIEIVDGPFTSRFFPIRDAGIRRDPVLQDLNRIRCRSALGPTRIHISMFYWKGRRGNYLATKLFNLARSGCRVNIIYGAPSRQIAARLRNAARSGLISLYDSRWDYNLDGVAEVRTHSKYVLVRGSYKRNPRKWVVMTGSPNWVAGSLSKGDESTLNIELKSAYDSYRRSWERVRAHSRKLPYS